MMSDEADKFVKEHNERHVDNAFYTVTSEVNGMADGGPDDILSLKITYAETPEALTKHDLKQLKFWMYKDDAFWLGKFLVESAQGHGENSSSTAS